jgi:hypothetical protein
MKSLSSKHNEIWEHYTWISWNNDGAILNLSIQSTRSLVTSPSTAAKII